MKQIEIFTDGACSGNPGPGGWGAVLRYNGHEKEISGGEANTTNNRMELSAVIEALSMLKEPCKVTLYSDSQYVCNGKQMAGCVTKKILHSTLNCGINFLIYAISTMLKLYGLRVTQATLKTNGVTVSLWQLPKNMHNFLYER